MGSRLRVIRELGIAVAVDGGELRPGGEDQRLDWAASSLHERLTETGLVLATFYGRRVVLGGQRLDCFVEAVLVQRVEAAWRPRWPGQKGKVPRDGAPSIWSDRS